LKPEVAVTPVSVAFSQTKVRELSLKARIAISFILGALVEGVPSYFGVLTETFITDKLEL
jgi:hypothetical protein